MASIRYDSSGDVQMEDIDDEVVVNAITTNLADTRKSTSEPRKAQPFDVRRVFHWIRIYFLTLDSR